MIFCLYVFVELSRGVCCSGLCPPVIAFLSVLPNVIFAILFFFKANKTKAAEWRRQQVKKPGQTEVTLANSDESIPKS